MTPSPDDAAASSTASSTADPDGGGGLFADGGGPPFDPAAPAPEPTAPEKADTVVELWDTERVRTVLTTQGAIVHGLVAVDKDSDEWRYTEDDLRAIAPPLARILNRYPVTQALAGTSDELMVAVGFGGYAIRSYGQRRAALHRQALNDAPPGPEPSAPLVTVEPVPGETVAEDDEVPPIGRRR